MVETTEPRCAATRSRLDPTLTPKQCPRRATHGEWCRQHAESLGGWRLEPPLSPAAEADIYAAAGQITSKRQAEAITRLRAALRSTSRDSEVRTVNGAELIAAERARQITEEGYDSDHDAGHAEELGRAAAVYAMPAVQREVETVGPDGRIHKPLVPVGARLWPWHPAYYKPTPGDRIRELVKAGALIAAAIDAIEASK